MLGTYTYKIIFRDGGVRMKMCVIIISPPLLKHITVGGHCLVLAENEEKLENVHRKDEWEGEDDM